LAIVFRRFGSSYAEDLNYIVFPIFFNMCAPAEGYSRNAWCALNLIFTFLLRSSYKSILIY